MISEKVGRQPIYFFSPFPKEQMLTGCECVQKQLWDIREFQAKNQILFELREFAQTEKSFCLHSFPQNGKQTSKINYQK